MTCVLSYFVTYLLLVFTCVCADDSSEIIHSINCLTV